MGNLFWTIAAKRVEKRCCARTLQKVVAKSRTTLFILKQLFANLQQPDLLQDWFDSRVVIRARSLFNSVSVQQCCK